nr:nucleoside kinase [uncultured Mediterraneibacter sp.]
MEGKIAVTIGEKVCWYEKGMTYQKIAQEYQPEYDSEIVLVFKDGYYLQELNKTLEEDCELSFVTTRQSVGYETYKRSMCLLLLKAIHDISGLGVRIQFSISKGLYCTLDGEKKPDRDFLDQVEKRMRELVEQKVPFRKRSVHTRDAVKMFREHNMHDKEHLFEYRRVSKVNIYDIDGYEDYYYGYMVPDTGYLKYFKLYLYDEGFVLQFPTAEHPTEIPEFAPQEKLFHVLKDAKKWGDLQNIRTVGDLNDQVTSNNMLETVLVEEVHQEQKIVEIARAIAADPEIKFVMIAGPSSSGKTTFSQRLSIALKAEGKRPHPISVDNYFVDREKTPKDENGAYNFECLEAIDVAGFNEDMQKLLRGEEVVLPTFDFELGRRRYVGKPKKLGERDILVIEGIHCLNPKLTVGLSDANKFKIYISALTQLNIDEHNRIPSTDGRLIRRIVRDARTRGTSAQRTIEMWGSVRRGEEENIFPYQEEADVMFNSALIYELAVLKQHVEPLLFGVEKESPEYVEAKRLLKFLDYFVGIGSEYVPNTSLVREFIGGGCFRL